MAISENKSKEFIELYKKYSPLVRKLSLKYSGYDKDLGEDIAQDILLQMYVEFCDGVVIENMPAYLNSITRNHARNVLKKRGREIPFDTREEHQPVKEESEKSAEETVLSQMEKKEVTLKLQVVLKEMKEKNEAWYNIVIKVFYEEKSQLEVAKELGMSDTALYATIRRIRKWSQKHKVNFEQDVQNTKEEVSKGHLFYH